MLLDFEKQQPQKPIITKKISLGTKHVDPDTGLIYFKYDFGYEFGIIFPGEGRKFVGGGNKISSNKQSSKALPRIGSGSIEIPVVHETTINGRLSAVEHNSYRNSHRIKFNNQSPIDINVDEFHTNDNDITDNVKRGTPISHYSQCI